MIQAIGSASSATASGASAGAFGAVPADYSLLLWLPPVVLVFGLAAWLVALVVLQRRRPRRLRSERAAGVAWVSYRFDPQTQP